MEIAIDHAETFEEYLIVQGQKMYARPWPNPDEEYGRFFWDGSFFIIRGCGDPPTILRVHTADKHKLEQLEKSWMGFLMAKTGGSMEEILALLEKNKEEQDE
jgi:hypothetical protein